MSEIEKFGEEMKENKDTQIKKLCFQKLQRKINPQEEKEKSKFREMMTLQMKRKTTLHQSGYFSETYDLENPNKYVC